MKNKAVFLTGFMGSGKSTIGPIVANTIGWEFYDLDKVIEQNTGMKIKDIFDVHGESYFRNLETETLTSLAHHDKVVIALGGGTIASDTNLERMKNAGIIVYLKLSQGTIYKRLKNKRDRPALLQVQGESSTREDLMKRINELYDKRKMYYEQSDFIIDTDNVSVGKTVDRLVKLVLKETEK
jgi:shikimate kinase